MGVQKKEPGSTLSSALSEAQSIVDEARRRSQEIIELAERKFDEAHALGYEEGARRGLDQTTRKGVRLIEQSRELSTSLAEEAAKLALAVCGSIIGEHVRVAPDTAKKIAITAIQQSVIGDRLTIVVNPEDEAVLCAGVEQIRKLAGGAGVTIEPSSLMQRGGCIIKTDFGEVDASIETLVDGVAQRLGIPRHGTK